jgi:hypothetical protein
MPVQNDSVAIQERIDQEKKKQQVLEQRRTSGGTKPYEPLGPTVDVLVPSFFRPTDLFYIVPVTQETLQKVCGGTNGAALAKIGCRAITDLPANSAKVPNKYNTGRYVKVQIIHGLATPTREGTDWGTTWTKTYKKNGDQSHRLIPFGYPPTETTPTMEDVVTLFDNQFGPGGGLHNVLGLNGSASLIFGKSGVVATHEGTA